jgi:hypothetical protein
MIDIAAHRLWWSFAEPPVMDLNARPVLGGRVLRYGALLDRVSSTLKTRLMKALNKQLVS